MPDLRATNSAKSHCKRRVVSVVIACGSLTVLVAILWQFVIVPASRKNSELLLIEYISEGDTHSALALIRSQRRFSLCSQKGPWFGLHPMHVAAAYQNSECLDLLLKYGEDCDVRDAKSRTPLMSAVMPFIDGNRVETQKCISLLLKYGADINAIASDDGGWTALHFAVFMNDPEMIKFLESSGADINNNAAVVGTPLHLSASDQYGGRVEAAEMLLKLGANTTIKNQNGETALEVAKKHKNDQLIEMLIPYEK